MLNRLQEFINDIKNEGVSTNTWQAYERDIRKMLNWLSEQGVTELANVDGVICMQYIDLLSDEGKSAATISRTIASLKKFFSFAKSRGYAFSDPTQYLKAPKVIRKAPSVISDRDMKKLLGVPDTSTSKGARDRAMLEMLTTTGVNASELIEMRLTDVDFRSQSVLIGEKKRRISVNRKTLDALKSYSKLRKTFITDGHEDDGTYFLSCSGEKMTRQGFWKIIRSCGNAAGLKEITPQILRHTFAVSLLKKGKDVNTLQKMLGHSSKAGSLEYQSYLLAQ